MASTARCAARSAGVLSTMVPMPMLRRACTRRCLLDRPLQVARYMTLSLPLAAVVACAPTDAAATEPLSVQDAVAAATARALSPTAAAAAADAARERAIAAAQRPDPVLRLD